MPRASAPARYHFDRQLRQNPAWLLRSRFSPSLRSPRCATSRRKVAASSAVRVFSSIAISSVLPYSISFCNGPIEASARLRRGAPADLVHRQVLLVGRDEPAVAERVLDPADAVAVEL